VRRLTTRGSHDARHRQLNSGCSAGQLTQQWLSGSGSRRQSNRFARNATDHGAEAGDHREIRHGGLRCAERVGYRSADQASNHERRLIPGK
jgi:hypothetical protein